MKRILKKLLLVIPIIFTLISIIYLFYYDGYRDVTEGRVHREAYDIFEDVGDVYEVRISLIMGEGKSDGTFPLRVHREKPDTYGTVVLRGDDLTRFLKLWESQWVEYRHGAICHTPAYGFRLYRRGKAVRTTTVCWSCSNFYFNTYPGVERQYGFHADSESGKKLLEFCDKLLPYRRKQ